MAQKNLPQPRPTRSTPSVTASRKTAAPDHVERIMAQCKRVSLQPHSPLIREEDAAFVRKIFEMACDQHTTLSSITIELNNRVVRTAEHSTAETPRSQAAMIQSLGLHESSALASAEADSDRAFAQRMAAKPKKTDQ